MKSLKEIFRIGHGPSSSHTMGPRIAAEQYKSRHPEAVRFRVTLYGSLAATGKGHLTDAAILEVLGADHTEIVWKAEEVLPFHPNGMRFEAQALDGQYYAPWLVFSVGGGALVEDGQTKPDTPDVYEHRFLSDILKWCEERGVSFWNYVDQYEDPSIWEYLREVWQAMYEAVERGLQQEGILPGGLNLRRKAATYHAKALTYGQSLRSRGLVFSYALAVSEENAGGGQVVTAPTCGACGIVPAVLYHIHKNHNTSEEIILRALATAGIFGNVAKTLASISGAEAGCQAEVGVACAMAAAASNYCFGGNISSIEYAAEMGLEHHLGMTCDPVCGLVQIPCIERNAHAAARALDANLYSTFSDGTHHISYDKAVLVMGQTGRDMPSIYRETSEGGLAVAYDTVVC